MQSQSRSATKKDSLVQRPNRQKIFGGTKRYQEKLSVDVSAEGVLLAFML